MLGRAACPLYKRELPFPVKGDIMDFEYDMIDSGLGKLRQCHKSFLGGLQEMYTSQIVLAGAFLYFCLLDYLDGYTLSIFLATDCCPICCNILCHSSSC